VIGDETSKPEILSAMDESPLAIHHVGVAVPSIDDAMHFYGDKLGLSVVESLELPDRQLKVAFVQAANMLIELLEPTDPNSTVSRFLERRGPGLHHLCFGTTDIRRHLRDLEDKGVELIDTEPRPGAHGPVAFLQPSSALGVLVELTQPSEASPATGSSPPSTSPATDVSPDPTSPPSSPTAVDLPSGTGPSSSDTPRSVTPPSTSSDTAGPPPPPPSPGGA
jgi:methylmalonyl-CoA epimerase